MIRRTPLRSGKPLQRKSEIKRIAMKPTPKKRASTAEKRHMDWVAGFGCLACGKPAEIHHVISDGNKRITRTNKRVTPLCPAHHRTGPHAVHTINHAMFKTVFGIDLLEWADAAWAASERREMA